MSLFNCKCRCRCTAAALLVSILIGVIAAFLLITGVITVTTVFLWAALGLAVVYLAVLVLSTALARRADSCVCTCETLNSVLAGILGTVLLSVILLAVGIVATSVVSAILVGLLLFFLSLTLSGTACYVRCLADCGG